jgi:hypothetical protein
MISRVVTGFSPKGYEEYGRRFLEGFDKHWPREIGLIAYVEEPVKMPRGSFRSLYACDGVGAFIDRHKDDPERNGRKPNDKWRERHRRFGYNFRFDAVKFCRQCFIPRHAAADMADGDLLTWLDGDVMTFDHPPKSFLDDLIGDADIAFLGRKATHSEIGYWSVRLNTRTRTFLNRFADVWESDQVFKLDEWHSAYVFDHSRRAVPMSERNLTPNGSGHVWFQSPLKKYTDHCKGARKALGYSPEAKR